MSNLMLILDLELFKSRNANIYKVFLSSFCRTLGGSILCAIQCCIQKQSVPCYLQSTPWRNPFSRSHQPFSNAHMQPSQRLIDRQFSSHIALFQKALPRSHSGHMGISSVAGGSYSVPSPTFLSVRQVFLDNLIRTKGHILLSGGHRPASPFTCFDAITTVASEVKNSTYFSWASGVSLMA